MQRECGQLRSALKELEQQGYIKRSRVRNEKGQDILL